MWGNVQKVLHKTGAVGESGLKESNLWMPALNKQIIEQSSFSVTAVGRNVLVRNPAQQQNMGEIKMYRLLHRIREKIQAFLALRL